MYKVISCIISLQPTHHPDRVQISNFALKTCLTANDHYYSVVVDGVMLPTLAMTPVGDIHCTFSTFLMLEYHVRACITILGPLHHPAKGEDTHLGLGSENLVNSWAWLVCGLRWCHDSYQLLPLVDMYYAPSNSHGGIPYHSLHHHSWTTTPPWRGYRFTPWLWKPDWAEND